VSAARVVALATAIALAAVAVIGRAKVVVFVPGAARLYAAVGVPGLAPGLDFRRVAAEIVGAGADAALVVEGEVANMSSDAKAVPVIELIVRNAGGQPFYAWTTDPPRRTLPPGEAAQFRARLAAPPREGTQVMVRFVSARSDVAAAP
jgi:hypothetical protein